VILGRPGRRGSGALLAISSYLRAGDGLEIAADALSGGAAGYHPEGWHVGATARVCERDRSLLVVWLQGWGGGVGGLAGGRGSVWLILTVAILTVDLDRYMMEFQ
jgi:hypothetical protein